MDSFQTNPYGTFPASQPAIRFVQYKPRVDPARQKNSGVHKPPANPLMNPFAMQPRVPSSQDSLTENSRIGSERLLFGARGNSIGDDSAGEEDEDLLCGLFSDNDSSDIPNADTTFAARAGDRQDMPILIDNDAATSRPATVSPDISEGTTAGFHNNSRRSGEVNTPLHPARTLKHKREPLSPDGCTKAECTEVGEHTGRTSQRRKRERQKKFERRGRPAEPLSVPVPPPVWQYKGLIDYQFRDGKSWVRVAWHSTWEPAEEFPPDEVDRAKRRRLEGHRGGARRRAGRPRKS